MTVARLRGSGVTPGGEVHGFSAYANGGIETGLMIQNFFKRVRTSFGWTVPRPQLRAVPDSLSRIEHHSEPLR